MFRYQALSSAMHKLMNTKYALNKSVHQKAFTLLLLEIVIHGGNGMLILI